MTVDDELSAIINRMEGTFVSNAARSHGSCFLLDLNKEQTKDRLRPSRKTDPKSDFGFMVELANWKARIVVPSLEAKLHRRIANDSDPQVIERVMPEFFGKRVRRARGSKSYIGLWFNDGSSLVIAADPLADEDSYTIFVGDQDVYTATGLLSRSEG